MTRQQLCLVVALAVVCDGLASGCGSSDATHAISPPVDTTKTTKPPTDTVVALAFDLRFKGVGVLSGIHQGTGSDITFAQGLGFPNQSGSPLAIGPGVCVPSQPGYGCGWFLVTYPLPPTDTGLVTWYIADYWSRIGSYFATTSPNDTVVTSLDFEPANSIFAYSAYVTSAAGGYTLNVHSVAPSGLQAAASQEGAQRRVITALSFLNGQIEYFAYAWQHDTVTAGYDTQVDTASIGSVPAAAQTLADAGYTITAFGGDSADGFVLVGTRIHGVTTPRTLTIVPDSRAGVLGSATVAFLLEPNFHFTVIAEK